MVRKLTRPGPQKPALSPEILAVGLALALVAALFVAMFSGAGAVSRDGCAAKISRCS